MKRVIFLLLFLLIFHTSYSGHFRGNGEFGYTLESNDFYVALEVGYIQPIWQWYLEAYGGIETVMEKSRGVFFSPYNVDYYVGGKINRKIIYINVEHHCLHPVLSRYIEGKWLMNEKMYAGGMTRFGVGFEF